MTLQDSLTLGLTVIASLFFVVLIISLGWVLIWKAFLSKFRLVRELLGQVNDEQVVANNHQPSERTIRARKIRKD